jgi:hypothetical protein
VSRECSLTKGRTFVSRSASFAFRKGSALTNAFSNEILRLRESGELDRRFDAIVDAQAVCASQTFAVESTALTADSVKGLGMVFGGVLLAAVSILVAEIVLTRRVSSRRERHVKEVELVEMKASA